METSPLITLLGRIYDGTFPLCGSGTDWEELLWDDIDRFQFSSQLYHLIRTRDLQQELPELFMQRLKMQADAVLFQNMLVRGEMNKLLRLFDQHGIEVLVLKGIRLGERYFGHFAARPTIDIDLLVRPGQITAAHELLMQEGFVKQEDEEDEAHFHSLYNKTFDNPMFPFIGVELHWNLLRTHISNTDAESCWHKAVVLGEYKNVMEMKEQETFYHLCLHGYNHDMLAFKQIHDIVHLLYTIGNALDYELLFQQARKDGNLAKVRLVLSLVYRLFPSLQARKPLKRMKRWPFWSVRLLRDKAFGGKGWRYYIFRLVTAWISHDTYKHRFAQLRYMFFPPTDYAVHLLHDKRDASGVRLYARIYRHRLQMWLRLGPSKVKSKSRSM